MRSAPEPLLKALTLEEKASLCSGGNFWQTKPIARLGIPALLLTDGPHGLRKQAGNYDSVDIRGVPATCFPTAAALANSWDRELLREIGVALGEECREERVAVLLGPGVNIKRSPLCGRNFEYFSEDPLLAGELAASWIDGVQSQGIGASLKHFAANNQEYRRMLIDAQVDTRALREIYLPAFEIAIKRAQPWTVMSAYNRLNGEYCGEHRWLLDTVLRGEWGFRGVVVSDWGGCSDRVASIRAGLDLEMPSSGGVNDARIVAAVRRGELAEAELDRVVERLLMLTTTAARGEHDGFRYDREAHHALAQRAAAEGAVLLKNSDALLPLRTGCRIAVIGEFAQQPRYQGAGSSQINPWRLDTALDALQRRGADIQYAAGYRRDDEVAVAELIDEASAIARAADVALIFAGLPEICESEGFDRRHLRMPASHNQLIDSVAAANPNTVVVLCSGAPVELPWLDRVGALVAAYLGGQAGGSAIVELLFGAFNPSGKLAESWPLRLEDTPAFNYFPGGPDTVEYRESLYVGYRHYCSARLATAFPFGHGLSYAQFEYSALQLSAPRADVAETLRVSLQVRNTGAVAGAEIVQLYVRDCESSVFRPERELKDFARVQLQPGEQREIRFELGRRAFAYFDADADDWRVESGEFELLLGASSVDIRLRASVWIEGDLATATTNRHPPLAHYIDLPAGALEPVAAAGLVVDAERFGALPRAVASSRTRPEGFHLNSALGDVRQHWLGRHLYQAVLSNARKMAQRSENPVLLKMMEEMVAEMPLRQLVAFSGGRLSFEAMAALLALLNGQLGSALRQLLALPFTRRAR